MASDATYQPGVYRKAGGNVLAVGTSGSINVAGGGAPTTGTLSAHTTSATAAGNDFAGTVAIVTDATGTAANVNLFVFTFATAKAVAPIVLLSNLSPGAGSASTFSGSYGAIASTTGFTVQGLAAVTASSTVTLGYLVIGVE